MPDPNFVRWTEADSLSYTSHISMPGNALKLVSIGCAAIIATSCAYHGGERQKHELKRLDGKPVTCFEPPPEVIQRVNVATDVDATVMEIGRLAKASVRGEATPERIRDKLPTDTAVFEVVDFRLCVNYANGVYSSEEYRALLQAKILFQKEGNFPVKDGASLGQLRKAERPWVTIKDARFWGPIKIDSSPRVKITFQNGGLTPAFETKVTHSITIMKTNTLPNAAMPTFKVKNESVSVMGPGVLTASQISLREPLNTEDVTHLQNKEWILVTFGSITYLDSDAQKHETRFCLFLNDLTGEALSMCDRWNESS